MIALGKLGLKLVQASFKRTHSGNQNPQLRGTLRVVESAGKLACDRQVFGYLLEHYSALVVVIHARTLSVATS